MGNASEMCATIITMTTSFFIAPTCSHAAAHAPRTSVCSRRKAVQRLSALCLLPLSPALAAAPQSGADAIGANEIDAIRARVKSDASLEQFAFALQRGDVRRAWFFGAKNEYCCYEDGNGNVAHIGEGYPVESASTQESPLHIMAKLRDL